MVPSVLVAEEEKEKYNKSLASCLMMHPDLSVILLALHCDVSLLKCFSMRFCCGPVCSSLHWFSVKDLVFG